MESLNEYIKEYKTQLSKGNIQKAYRGIMIFMSGLKTDLEKNYLDYIVSSLYFWLYGYDLLCIYAFWFKG